MSGRRGAARDGRRGREGSRDGNGGRERGHRLVIPVVNLLRRPGSRQRLEREVPAEELRVGDASVARGTPVQLDLVLEAASGDQVTVTGTVRAPYLSQCRRCLEPVEGEAFARLQEVFDRRPVEGETYQLEGESVDLGELVRDALLLALPLAPLCRDDCAGPAPELYPTSLEEEGPGAAPSGAAAEGGRGEPGEEQPSEGDEGADAPRDPRWAALRDLRFD